MAQLTILGLGIRPDTTVVKDAGIECNKTGHIVANDHLETSVENIWAAGDSVQVCNPILEGQYWTVPLAGPANRMGRMVADNIAGMQRRYRGTYGTSVVRVFDLVVASAGLYEKVLRSESIGYASVHVHPSSHAGYYPGASQIHLKLIFDKTTGNIYGAQAVGKDGVEKRIDVIATAIQGKMTVEDPAEIELYYAPPVGSAKDPVNMAGMAAQNVVEGIVSTVNWKDMEELANSADTVILDVRGPSELSGGKSLAHNAMNIPLNDLHSRLSAIPKDKQIVVSCFSGQSAYYACRILMQRGFERVGNLSGAFLTFHSMYPGGL